MKKRNITLWALTFLGALFGAQAFAQTNVNMPYNNGPATFTIAPPGTCFFNFFDNGGSAANYSNNSGVGSQVTFAPATAGQKIQATFASFQTESGWDALYVYDAPDITNVATLIASPNGAPAGAPNPFGNAGAGGWWNNIAPNNVAANVVRATAANTSGALTFAFDSDGSVSCAGWQATVLEFANIPTCAMTAPANIAASTGTVNCTADVTTALPSFSPGGCASGLALTYSLNGGTPVTIAAPFPASITLAGIPKGTNTVVWQLRVACGGQLVSSATQTITVNDLTKPTITCPANVTFNLSPGECSQLYSYTVTATDNCPFFGPLVKLPTSSQTANNAFNGITFDIQNVGTQPILINSFTAPISAGVHPVVAYYTTTATTAVGNAQNAAAWTLMGNATVTGVGGFPNWPTFTTIPIGGLQLNPGQRKGIYLAVTDGGEFGYANGALNTNDGTLQIISQGHSGGQYPFINANNPRVFIGSVTYQTTLPGPPLVQTAGLPTGAEFPIGTTCNSFTVTDLAGNTNTCSFCVTINEYPNAITALVCNDLVQVSMDEDCSVVLNADQILEGGPYGCYDNYIVELDRVAPYGNGPWTPGVLGPNDVGHTYGVRVTDPKTGNKCWGNIKVEDKLPPVLDCQTASVPCNFPSLAPEYQQVLNNYTAKFTGTGLPQTLLDFQTINSPIEVSGATGTIQDVDFYVKLTGNALWFGNITIRLTSPSGTVLTAWQGVGGCGTAPIWVRFDDEGSQALTCADYSTGVNAFIPFGFGTLSTFDGENPNGTWTASFSDVDGFGDVNLVEETALFITSNYTFTTGFPNALVYPTDVTGSNKNYTVNPGAGTPQMDNCSAVNLTYIDTEVPQNCASGLTSIINRKWTATDASGNTATCIQQIRLNRPTDGDITLPPNYDDITAPAFQCAGAYPTPDWIEGQGLQGKPHIFGDTTGCSVNYAYVDQVIKVCDGTYKIARHWTVINWCTGTTFEPTQIVKVLDTTGPSFTCPANLTVTTDPFTCCASADLPDFIVTDNCSRLNSVDAMVMVIDPQTGQQIAMHQIFGSFSDFNGNNKWNPDTMAVLGTTPCLPLGTHTVVYTVKDDCGNTSTCSFRLTVRDYTPPVAACDEYTIVSIGVDDPYDCYLPTDACTGAGVTWVKATTFDDGSYDNCGDIHFTIQRMQPYSPCILALNDINGHPECDKTLDPFPDFPSEFERATSEYDSIKFYCCEVGLPPQTVILRVYQLDANGNITVGPDGTPVSNSCMIQVEVQDKIKPVCQSPANVTVSCENFDPSLWAYGKATVVDNCCLDTAQVYQGQCGLSHTVNYGQFDTVCNKGTIIRNFRAFDCHGQQSQCSQRIIVNYEQDYYVKFPDDRIVTTCDGTGNYGEPSFYGEDCELLGVSFEDEIFTVVPDACYKIERTWTIINWCTYNPNLPCIYIPNPNPSATLNSPTNNTGPTVSACGTPAPWAPTITKINPTDPTSTNYCTFWDANANCYKYKQIIKIIDNQAPTIDCPPSPQTYNDLTPNDANLWNESYWWDNTIGSHNLCEGPADLCVTATDACSGSDINIRYLLFLDLDNDGDMETVISSTNLPGYNNVFYGNAHNSNFSGGTPRQFDERPVAPNQKYGFTIQTTVSGKNKTACVKWNTQQAPNTYVTPELPYGTHKIKWIVSDGCGNEQVCEYTVVVKDGKKPTVVCINGLSVNIMPTKMITLWASDFLKYTEDNCTPADQIKIGIRKAGAGTGFPTNPDGTPQTSVTFDCTELGTRLVELWGMDKASNADFCQTYVIVQDNMNNCTGAGAGTVAGTLKTEMTNGLEDATVTLTGNHPALPGGSVFDITDNAGKYELNGIPYLGDFTLTPSKDNDPLNGVSTFDLVLINKHILGLEPLNTPYKMIAADANNSRSITTFDIVELRKLILGIYTELPNNTSWRFVDKAYGFPTPTNPFAEIFPETKQIANMTASMAAEDFVSVKVGDVNGNAVTNSLVNVDDRTAGTLLFDVEDRMVNAGETFTVNFKADEKVQGYQFTMNYNNLDVVDVAPGANMKLDNFAVFSNEHALTTSWDGDSQAEFAVTFRAKAGGMLSQMLGVSSRITRAEAYNANSDRLQVAFRFNGQNGSTISGLGFELYQNTPNPFVSKTQIGFYLPEAAEATLTIFDESGRTIFTQTGDFAKGNNAITVNRNMLNATGVLYYKLETANNSATKKMIQTK